MDKYVEGMKSGAKPFEDNLNKIADNIKKEKKEIQNDINSIQDNINDIVDIIAEEDPLNRKELLETLKNNKKANIKPKNFEISVVYDKENTEIADQIRESLNNNGNAASMLLDLDFKKNNRISDYVIHLEPQNYDASNSKVIFNGNGCVIKQCGNHYYTSLESVDLRKDSEWSVFKETYKSLMDTEIERNKQLTQSISTIDTVLKEKNKRDNIEKSHTNSFLNFIGDMFDKVTFTTSDWPLPLQVLFGFPAVLLTFFASIIGAIIMIPVGLTEITIGEVINSLDKRDSIAIKKAQKDILKVKLVECIRNEQLKEVFN